MKIADGANELGRFEGRVGNFEEAKALLAEARELFLEEGDEVERTVTTPGVDVFAAMLHRLRGWAYMQLRDLESARGAFDESLRLARVEGENVGMRSADYEIALTLDALDQLGELVGDPAVDLERERDALMAKLSVLKLSRPPLPD